MIVRETPWDDRNLGLSSCEITVAGTDCDDDVITGTITCRGVYGYCLVKFPQKRIALAHRLEQEGFRFLEAQLDLHKNLLRPFPVAPFLEKSAEAGICRRITDQNDCEALFGKIAGVFDSDRIFLDPVFGADISAERYRNWIRNSFEKPEYHCVWICAGDVPVGFFFMEEKGDAADSSLSGLFAEFKNKGFGPLAVSTHIGYALSLGKKKLVTRVSLNNIESLRMHLAFGYEVSHANYVMRCISGARI